MEINKFNFLKPDNLFLLINQNKNILFIIIILLGIYLIYYNKYIIENTIYLFDTNFFKLIIFIIIIYIVELSPIIGIILTIIILVSMQIITYFKLKNELDNETKLFEYAN